MYGPARHAPQYRPRPPGQQLPPPPGTMNINRPPYGPPVMQGRGGPMHPPPFCGQQQQPGYGQHQQQQQPQSGFGPPPSIGSSGNQGIPPGPPAAPMHPGSLPPAPPIGTMGPIHYPPPPMVFRLPPPIAPPSFTVFPQNPAVGAPPPPMLPPSPPPLPPSPPPSPPPPPPASPMRAEASAEVLMEDHAEVPRETSSQAVAEVISDSPKHQPMPLNFRPAPPAKPIDEEVVCNIETLARYVVKNGPEFEKMARAKEAGNPKFAFLFGGEPRSDPAVGFEYFQWMKMKCEAELKICNEADDKQIPITLPMSAPTDKFERVVNASGGVSNIPAVSDANMQDICYQPEFEGPSVEDLSPVQSSPKDLQNSLQVPFVQDVSPVRFCPGLLHTSEGLHVEDLSPVKPSVKKLQHVSKAIGANERSPVQSSPEEHQHTYEGDNVEDPSFFQSSPKGFPNVSEGLHSEHHVSKGHDSEHCASERLHVEDLSPVQSPKGVHSLAEAAYADLSPVHSLRRLQEMYIEDLSPVRYSPKESEKIPEGPYAEDLSVAKSSPKEVSPTTTGHSEEDMSHVEPSSEQENISNSSEADIETEGHTSSDFGKDQAIQMIAKGESDSLTKKSSDCMSTVCESSMPASVCPVYELGDKESDNNMDVDMRCKEVEPFKSFADNNVSNYANKPLKDLSQAVIQDNNIRDLGNAECNLEKPTNQENKMPNVDEFGRLIREGASDSESDGVQYTAKVDKVYRSQSRSRSPVDRGRTRRTRSPRRWRGRKSRSRSRSPRRKRSRSRTPTAEFRNGGESVEGKRRSTVRECIFFKREGGCKRGASCRFIHQEMPVNNVSKWSGPGRMGEYRESKQDIEKSHTAKETSGYGEEGNTKVVCPDTHYAKEKRSENEKHLNDAMLNDKGSSACNDNSDLQISISNLNPDSQLPVENAKSDSDLHQKPLENKMMQSPLQKGTSQSELVTQESFYSQPSKYMEITTPLFSTEGSPETTLPMKDFTVSQEGSGSQPLSKPSASESFQSPPLLRPPLMESSQSMPLSNTPLVKPPSNAPSVSEYQACPQPMEDFRHQPLPVEAFHSYTPFPRPPLVESSQSIPLSNATPAMPFSNAPPRPASEYQACPQPMEDFRHQPLPVEDFHSHSPFPRPPLVESSQSMALSNAPPPADYQARPQRMEEFQHQHLPVTDFHSHPPFPKPPLMESSQPMPLSNAPPLSDYQARPQPMEDTPHQPLPVADFHSHPPFPRLPLMESSQPMPLSNAPPVSDYQVRLQPMEDTPHQPLPVEDFHSQPPFPRPPLMESSQTMPLSNAPLVSDYQAHLQPMEDSRQQPLPMENLNSNLPLSERFSSRVLRGKDFHPRPLTMDDFRNRPLLDEDIRSRTLNVEDYRSRPLPIEDFRSRPLEDFRSRPLEDFRSRLLPGDDLHSRKQPVEELRSRAPLVEDFRPRPLPVEDFRSHPMSLESFSARNPLMENFRPRLTPTGSLHSQPFIREDAHRENFHSHLLHRQDLHGPPLAREDLHLHSTHREVLRPEPVVRRDFLGRPLFMNDSQSLSLLREGLQHPHIVREDLHAHGLPRGPSQFQVPNTLFKDPLHFPHFPREDLHIRGGLESRENLLPKPFPRDDPGILPVPRDLPNLQQHDITRQLLSSTSLMQQPGYSGAFPPSSNHGSFTSNRNSDSQPGFISNSMLREADMSASLFTAGNSGFPQNAPFRLGSTLHHLSGGGQVNHIPRSDPLTPFSPQNVSRPGIEPLPRLQGSYLTSMGGEWRSHPYHHLGGSVVAGPSILPQSGREFSAPGDQYDPLHDSIEPPSGPNDSLKKLLESGTENNNDIKAADRYNMAPVLDNLSPYNAGRTRIGSSSHLLDVEENNKHKNGATSAFIEFEADNVMETVMDAEVGAVENESPVLEEEVKNWSPGHPLELVAVGAGEIEIDQVQTTAKSKKNKDSRSMKLFRSALAEFVKETLKPSWREGNMSKEAFKTIVKKAVDKVAGAMQSHQVPKSRAKIDHYMTSSEPKLTKLVQGYMNKYIRSMNS